VILNIKICRHWAWKDWGAHPDASRQAELRNTVLRSCRCTIDGYSGRADLYGTPFFHLFSTWKKVPKKCRAHTGAWRKEMRFVPARPKTHRPMSASSDYSEFKTVLVLRGRLSKEDNKCPSSPSPFRVPTHPHPRYHKVKPSAIQL
jgi:hypothetical protein